MSFGVSVSDPDGSERTYHPEVGNFEWLHGTLPEPLDPIKTNSPFVHYTPDTLRTLSEMGYDRIGAAVFAYDQLEGNIQAVLGLHAPSDKNPDPVWSLPSETSQYFVTDDGEIVVENSLQTAVRCIQEELQVDDGPIVLPRSTPWIPTEWPIGSAEGETRKIFAPFMPIGLPDIATDNEGRLALEDGELLEARFFQLEKLFDLAREDRRAGATEAIIQAMLYGAFIMFASRNESIFSDRNLLIQDIAEWQRTHTITTIGNILMPYKLTRDLGVKWRDAKFKEMPI